MASPTFTYPEKDPNTNIVLTTKSATTKSATTKSATKGNIKPKATLKIKPRKRQKSSHSVNNVYAIAMMQKKVVVPITIIGGDIKDILEKEIAGSIEGKCITEGYVKQNTVKVLSYSCGTISGSNVVFEVQFECLTCLPVEGMYISCVAKDVTKAGIRATTNEEPSPIIVFVARDHHYTTEEFSKVKAGDQITIKVIGQRFELNDPYVSIIAELANSHKSQSQSKPRLVIRK